jgi:hypothetical protein
MQDTTLGRQKITGDIATVLGDPAVDIDDAKVTDLLMRCNKVFRDKLAYLWV